MWYLMYIVSLIMIHEVWINLVFSNHRCRLVHRVRLVFVSWQKRRWSPQSIQSQQEYRRQPLSRQQNSFLRNHLNWIGRLHSSQSSRPWQIWCQSKRDQVQQLDSRAIAQKNKQNMAENLDLKNLFINASFCFTNDFWK